MTVHGDPFFRSIVRDETSSDGSQRQEYNEESMVNLEARSQGLEGKGSWFLGCGKCCVAIGRSVIAVSSSGVQIEIGTTEVEEEEEEIRLRTKIKIPPNHVNAELLAAGWPSWLIADAREALIGWIPWRADSFEMLDKIGQGKHSNVYKARDCSNGKIVALKKIRCEPETVRFVAREIIILRRLDHPNIMKLEGLVTARMSCRFYLVFEYMEHDLAGLAYAGIKFTEPQVKFYMQQLLLGIEHCHHCGILHRDIKGSDILLDNAGILKIADFGSASFFDPHHKQPMTSREGSLWYRPPELLLGATVYGVAVDLWSVGCILAELLAGKPIMPGRTEVEQVYLIFKLCGTPSEKYWEQSKLPDASVFKSQGPYQRCIAATFKDFPPSSLSLIETLLAIDPAERKSATAALNSEFFTTKPYPCDPSVLPKYPPSKEYDTKWRDGEAKRQRAAASRGCGSEYGKRDIRSSARLHHTRGWNSQPRCAEKQLSSKYNQLDDTESSHHFLDRPASSHKKGDKGYGVPRNNWINYSGPLLPPGGKIGEMLKKHNWQIQLAIHRARLDKVKTKKNFDDSTQSEALLHPGRNDR